MLKTVNIKPITLAVLLPLFAIANTNLYETQYQYNNLGEAKGVVNNNMVNGTQMSSFSYYYDQNGDAITVTKIYGSASAVTLNYTYDALGNMVSDNSSVNNISYRYDLNNNLRSVNDKSGDNTRNYNSLNQLVSVVGPISNSTFTYDAMDAYNLASDSDHNAYRYDVNDNLSSYTSPNNQTINYTYTADANRYTEQSSNSIQYFYFSGNQLVNVNAPGESNLTSYIFGVDGKDLYFDNNATAGILLSDLNANIIGAGELSNNQWADYNYTYQDLDQNDPLSQKQAGDINLIGFNGSYFDALNQNTPHAMVSGMGTQQWVLVGSLGTVGLMTLGSVVNGIYKCVNGGNDVLPSNPAGLGKPPKSQSKSDIDMKKFEEQQNFFDTNRIYTAGLRYGQMIKLEQGEGEAGLHRLEFKQNFAYGRIEKTDDEQELTPDELYDKRTASEGIEKINTLSKIEDPEYFISGLRGSDADNQAMLTTMRSFFLQTKSIQSSGVSESQAFAYGKAKSLFTLRTRENERNAGNVVVSDEKADINAKIRNIVNKSHSFDEYYANYMEAFAK